MTATFKSALDAVRYIWTVKKSKLKVMIEVDTSNYNDILRATDYLFDLRSLLMKREIEHNKT